MGDQIHWRIHTPPGAIVLWLIMDTDALSSEVTCVRIESHEI